VASRVMGGTSPGELMDEWRAGMLSISKPSAGVHLRPERTTKLFVDWMIASAGLGNEV
jgi:hypothetical protein